MAALAVVCRHALVGKPALNIRKDHAHHHSADPGRPVQPGRRRGRGLRGRIHQRSQSSGVARQAGHRPGRRSCGDSRRTRLLRRRCPRARRHSRAPAGKPVHRLSLELDAPGAAGQHGYLYRAGRVGRKPWAARAAGAACAKNLVPLVVPCHRIVRSDGSLGGYYYGLAIKRWLLAHEGVA
ncbi:methylated-DNA--[protein]-cysteine S-methyltransferase [Lentzea indica]|uniref:methylated-DNA--[protein]-cysteine S-methyltransferase n=1 Tax=Lentzea indica TaxID=2604800 RepID=UPI0028AC9787|nr:methylated-DNA--[protein]-cysteine S-methyltransferase [Lentzea indica]